jgi:beta-lactamase regulating signal transducer with metallopeptidase domain
MNLSHFSQISGEAFDMVLRATWAATVLAIVVCGIQIVFGRRLSAGWRFGLWLLVIFRLLIPVFPSSAVSIFNAPHWLETFRGRPAQVTVEIKRETVHQRLLPAQESPGGLDKQTLPKPVINKAGMPAILLTSWGVICGLLLFRLGAGGLWLMYRLRQEGSTPAPELTRVLMRARKRMKTFWTPKLIETSLADSPGLFGFFRPILLVPRGLAQKLSETELEYIFLHELGHLRRWDLAVNFLMAVAQATHWFNPVVWLVCRQMRLERELACDRLALEETGGSASALSYGETILKLLGTLSPRSTLPGVVGIMEEKQAARLRLKQISSFTKSEGNFGKFAAALLLVVTAVVGMSNAQDEKAKVESAIKNPPDTPEASKIERRAEESSSGENAISIQTNVVGFISQTNRQGKTTTQIVPKDVLQHAGRKTIEAKLKSIVLPHWEISGPTSLSEVIKILQRSAREHDPKKSGLNFIISSSHDSNKPQKSAAEEFVVEPEAPLKNATLEEVLNQIVAKSHPPEGVSAEGRIKYSIGDYAVVFSAREPDALYTRTYKVDPVIFEENLERAAGVPKEPSKTSSQLQEIITNYFHGLGVSFPASPGQNAKRETQRSQGTQRAKAIYYDQERGILFVRGTLADLDRIESALQKLNTTTYPIEYYCWIVSLPISVSEDFKKTWLTEAKPANSANAVATVAEAEEPSARSGSEQADLVRTRKNGAAIMEAPGKVSGSRMLGAVSLIAFNGPPGNSANGETADIKTAAGVNLRIHGSYDPNQQLHQVWVEASIPTERNRMVFTASSPVHEGETLIFAKKALLPKRHGVSVFDYLPGTGLFGSEPTEERYILFFVRPKAR